MAKERDKRPNYPRLKIRNGIDDLCFGDIQDLHLPSCFVLGEKLRDVTVLR